MNKITIEGNNIIINETKFILENKTIDINENCQIDLKVINSKLKFIIGENIEVTFKTILLDKEIENVIEYNIKENSKLNILKFNYNKKTKENIIMNLEGKNSKVNYIFANISDKDQEYNIRVNHNNTNTNSNIINNAVNFKNNILKFDVSTKITKGNIECKANQETRIIAKDTRTAIINPKLLISEENVVARHAATIGALKDEEIFYMESRGITNKEAMKLIVKGFLLHDMPYEYKEEIFEIINNNWR